MGANHGPGSATTWEPAPSSHPLWGSGPAPPFDSSSYGPQEIGQQDQGSPGVGSPSCGPRPIMYPPRTATKPPPLRGCGSLIHTFGPWTPSPPNAQDMRSSHKAPGNKELCKPSTAAQRPSSNQRSGDVTGKACQQDTSVLPVGCGGVMLSSLNLL